MSLFRERSCEVVIHVGDLVAPFAAKRLLVWNGPMHVIYGNNDGERLGLKGVLPQIQDGPLRLELGGRRVTVHHFIDWCKPEDMEGADLVITGHTHEIVDERDAGRWLLNPGECCGWLTGRCTVAIVETGSMTAEIVEVTS